MNGSDSTAGFANSLRDTDQDVHLWRIPLLVQSDEVPCLRTALSSEERERVERFATARLARRFTVCRAATRSILAGYAGMDAGELEFRHGPHGKPALIGPGGKDGVRFNVSHSADLAVLAVTWHREVGVDVEAIKQIMHLDRMVQRCLSPAEQRAFREQEGASETELFLTYWTHKEAYLKAIGEGLRLPLAAIEFDLHHQERSRITRQPDGYDGHDGRTTEFQVTRLALGDGYRGALVAQGSDPIEIRYAEWRA